MPKNLISEQILAHLVQIWVPNFFPEFYLYQLLDSVLSYYPMQFKGKLKNQTWQNDKKTNFGSHFGPFGPNLGPQNFFLSFTTTSG